MRSTPTGKCSKLLRWRSSASEQRLELGTLDRLLKLGDGKGVAAILDGFSPEDMKTGAKWRYEIPLSLKNAEDLSNGGMGNLPLPPILHAVSSDSASCVIALLSQGADMFEESITDGNNWSPITSAIAGAIDNKREAMVAWVETVPETQRPLLGLDEKIEATIVDFVVYHKHKDLERDIILLGCWTFY